MKRLRTCFLIVSVFISILAYASEKTNRKVTLTKSDAEMTKGHRMKPAPEYCVVNFSDYTIETSISSEVVGYELWDADGIQILTSCMEDGDFVEYMATVNGAYQLRLLTEDDIYIGYIEL